MIRTYTEYFKISSSEVDFAEIIGFHYIINERTVIKLFSEIKTFTNNAFQDLCFMNHEKT